MTLYPHYAILKADAQLCRMCATGILRGDSTEEREMKMQIVTQKPVLECTMSDVFELKIRNDHRRRNFASCEVYEIFTGGNKKTLLRMQVGDHEVIFENLELLKRFSQILPENQELIIQGFWDLMVENGIDQMKVEIQWTETGATRNLSVEGSEGLKDKTLKLSV